MSALLQLPDEMIAGLRLECLKLALEKGERGLDAIATARAYADFILGAVAASEATAREK